MSFGAQLGMKFIDKGIDQFNYGVSQEYNRYAREKSRKWQMIDNTNQLSYRINDGAKHGIHPLAAIGASTSPGAPIAVGGSQPPFSSGPLPIPKSANEKRIESAIADKAEAEAELVKLEVQKMGQNGSQIPPSGVLDSQTPSDGISHTESQMKYEKSPMGYFYLVPRNSEAYGDEGTLGNRARFLIEEGQWLSQVKKLKNGWFHPSNQEFKKIMLATRPPVRKGYIALMYPTGQWREVPRTSKNSHWIFHTELPARNLRGGKKHAPKTYGPVS